MARWNNAVRSGRNRARRAGEARHRKARLQSLEARCVLSSGYLQTNLVSDQTGAALIRDFNLVDPWGIGVGPSGGAFWVADHGSGRTSLYAGDASGTPFARNPLVVSVPDGGPTGEVANGTSDFTVSLGAASGPAAFLMAGGSGTLSGWNQDIPLPAPSTQAQPAVVDASAAYTGLTIAYDGVENLLYAANFAQGTIDVFDGSFSPVSVDGAFADAAVPAGFAPYNIANLGGRLYVSYARQNGGQINPAPGGGGLVAVFDYQGNLLKNLGSGGALDAPWGMALAPVNFGQFSGDLLVGNSGDGRIHAFNPDTGAMDGALATPGGAALTIDGLRGLTFGNGQTAGDYYSLYFTAGPDGGEHGLFGAIKSAQFVELSAAGVSATAYQGAAFQGVVATFADANAGLSAGSYATTIYWGDGDSSTGSVSALGGGRFNLTGTHVYSQTGLQSITISIRDSESHLVYASAVANVKTPMLTATGASGSATEDAALSAAVATFSDADGNLSAGAYQAWIDWGDGTVSEGTVAGDGSGNFSVTGSHTYTDEANLSVQTFIVDSDGDELTATGTVSIADADTLSAVATALAATEGLLFSSAVATFSDTNLAANAGDFAATIDWGDGSTTSGVIDGANGQFTVSGSHAYAHSGEYDVNVAVNDPSPGTASASATATAQVAASPITATGYTFSAVEGQQFAGAVAFFTSANPSASAGDFTATILWGDGSSSTGVISASGETFHVSGAHAYAAMSTGIAAKVLISEQGGVTATAEGWALVADAPLVATAATVSGYEKSALADVKLAGFRDQGTPQAPSAYSATINWGDGATTAGTVAADGAGFKILGTHVYGDEGTYSFTVSVAETGGANDTVHGTAVMLETLLWNGTRGTPTDRWINEVYGDFLGRLADPGALSYWNSQLAQGANRNTVVSAIEASGEYRAREVQALFERYLRRPADPGGQAYFVARLAAGATIESVAASLIGSQEYFMNRGGGANEGYLNALYQDVLQRPADPGALAYFGRLLSSGVSRSQVASVILNSDEYRQRLIGDFYQQLLNHPTSNGSINFWLNDMKQGARDEQVAAGIAGSDEYFNRTAP